MRTTLCVVVLDFAGLLAAVVGSAEGQEAEKAKPVKSISIGKSPCVFFSSSQSRGSLGVHLIDLTPELRTHFGAPADAGVMVSKVVEESPASRAGIRVGDIITAIDGEEVSSAREVSRAVRRKKEGDEAALEVRREGKLTPLNAVIEERERSVVDLGGFLAGDCDEVDIDMDIHIDEESIRGAIENAKEQFRSPLFRSQWRWLEKLDDESLEEKIKGLEQRLKTLERELEEKSKREEE